jgi:septal ring factor EnvC (AmiA/AmiB activator)
VAEHAEASGSLALSRRPRDAARTHPRAMSGSAPLSAASVLPRRPAPPAEIAQARVFERLLQAEGAELQELADRIAGDNDQRSRASEELAQLHARIDEVHALLRTLHGRFPHSPPDGDR